MLKEFMYKSYPFIKKQLIYYIIGDQIMDIRFVLEVEAVSYLIHIGFF